MFQVYAPKLDETKLSSKQTKQGDTHNKSVKIIDATTIKIVDQKNSLNTPVI
jgi:hypothetical protein